MKKYKITVLDDYQSVLDFELAGPLILVA